MDKKNLNAWLEKNEIDLCINQERLLESISKLEKKSVFFIISTSAYSIYKANKQLQDELFKREISCVKELFGIDEIVKGKTVYIFDNIYDEKKIMYYYEKIKKCGANEVIPFVCVVSGYELLARDGLNGYKRKMENLEVWNRTKYNKICVGVDFGRKACYEQILFHTKLLPFTTENPILKVSKTLKENSLSKIEFEKICQKRYPSNFEYSDNTSKIEELYLYQGVFKYLGNIMNFMAFDAGVMCKYNINADDVEIMFMPFVFMRALKHIDIWKSFVILYKGTEYYDNIVKYLKKHYIEVSEENIVKAIKEDHEFANELYKSILFQLSLYVGFLFKEEVKEQFGIELCWDFEPLKLKVSQSFYNTIIIQVEKWDNSKFRKILLYEIPIFETIEENVYKSKNYYDCDYDLELYIQKNVIDYKYNREGIVKVDELYTMLYDEVDSPNLTRCVLNLLEKRCISYSTIIDSDCIYSVFEPGQNCEIFFPENIEYVLLYVYHLYHMTSQLYYKDYIEELFNLIEVNLIEEKYLRQQFEKQNYKLRTEGLAQITKFAFELYKDYFIHMQAEYFIDILDCKVMRARTEIHRILQKEITDWCYRRFMMDGPKVTEL